MKTSSMEECVDEVNQVEVTSSIETPHVEEFSNEKEKRHGQEKLPERVNNGNTFVQEKKHDNTAFSIASSLSSTALFFASYHRAFSSTRRREHFFSAGKEVH